VIGIYIVQVFPPLRQKKIIRLSSSISAVVLQNQTSNICTILFSKFWW